MNPKNTDAKTISKCPRDETFIKAFMNNLDLEENEKLIDHILACQKCKTKFNLLQQLSVELKNSKGAFGEEELTKQEEKQFRRIANENLRALKGQKTSFFILIPVKYVVVVLILITIAAAVIIVPKMSQREIYRETENQEFRLIEPNGKISKFPDTFTWNSIAGADNYLFRLIDEDLNTLFTIGTKETHMTLPENVKSALKKGKTYLWKVEVIDDDEKRIGSASQYFKIE